MLQHWVDTIKSGSLEPEVRENYVTLRKLVFDDKMLSSSIIKTEKEINQHLKTIQTKTKIYFYLRGCYYLNLRRIQKMDIVSDEQKKEISQILDRKNSTIFKNQNFTLIVTKFPSLLLSDASYTSICDFFNQLDKIDSSHPHYTILSRPVDFIKLPSLFPHNEAVPVFVSKIYWSQNSE